MNGKVLNLLQEAKRSAKLNHPTEHINVLPHLLKIAKAVKRNETSTHRSLRRLEKQGKFQECIDGWVLTDATPHHR